MPITIDIEKDYLYNRGLKDGYKKSFEKGFKIGFKIGFEEGLREKSRSVILAAFNEGTVGVQYADSH